MTEDLYGHLRERGLSGWEEVMGPIPEGYPPPPVGSFLDLTNKLVFGDVFQRPHLTLRERRLVTLTAMAARGHDDCTVQHIRAAMRMGDLSDDDLEELIIQMAFYLGWPPAMAFWLLVNRERAALAEEEVASTQPT
jgi:4-carboxymuconolactone decarboxylase